MNDDVKILYLEKPLDVSWNLFLSVNKLFNVVQIVAEYAIFARGTVERTGLTNTNVSARAHVSGRFFR